jgi:hypothetical protein
VPLTYRRHCERSEAIHLCYVKKAGLLRRGVYHRAGQRPDPLALRNDGKSQQTSLGDKP